MSDANANRRFYELIWPHRAVVLRTAQILTGSAADAEDLAQETMIKAFRGLDRFDANTNVKKWLFTILRNARIDAIRASKSAPATASLDALGEASLPEMPHHVSADEAWDNPEAILEQFSDQGVIHALQQLDEDVRWTLLLVDVEGLNDADAAAILDVPVGTIKSRAHRGRARLRAALLPFAEKKRLIRSVEREVHDERT